jgi:glycosyltransferase involved in cell wall biosynthesis
VLPSLLEGLGIPPVEAMAAGIPVVITRGGASEEVVGNAGLTTPPREGPALAGALNAILSDRALAARLGAAGKVRAFEMFDPGRATDAVEGVYRRVLEGRS